MIILTHSLAGAAVASQINNIGIAFLLGFLSHFVLDAIPHFDQGTIVDPYGEKNKVWPKWVYWTLAFDILITIIFFYYLRNRSDISLLIWGAIGAVSVDAFEQFPWKGLIKLPVFKQISWLHNKVHFWLPREKWYIGLISEILVTGGTIWFLLKY